MDDTPIVYVVDDDLAASEAIASALSQRGVTVERYHSMDEFLARFDRARDGCLIADLRTGGVSDGELQQRLRREQIHLPLIVVTGGGDVATAVSVMRQGALTFLEKPCAPDRLWENVCEAICRHKSERKRHAQRLELRQRFALLSDSEREVLTRLAEGKPNKVIAAELNISLRTVEMRRAIIHKKMGAHSLAELLRMHFLIRDGSAEPPADGEWRNA